MNYKEKLEQAIEEGKTNTSAALASIEHEHEIREDFMVKNDTINIQSNGGYATLSARFNKEQGIPTEKWFTSHSENQVLSHYGIPRTYLDKLQAFGMHELIETNFSEIAKRRFSDEHVMLRVVEGDVKGWLSPSYKRLDAAPILGAFVEESMKMGMVPIKGFNTASRYQIRFAFPSIITPLGMDNESTIIGASLSTSDYGGAAFKAELFIMRLICLNGMIGDILFCKVHMGSRFSASQDTHFLSKNTHSLDIATMQSATRDLVRSLPPRMESIKGMIETAFAKEPSRAAWDQIKKATNKETNTQILNAYNMETDVTLLPKEKSTWRLANAISLVAQAQGNDDNRIDLENLAMKIVA